MATQIKKIVMLSVRLRPVEGDLLEQMALFEGMNVSELIRKMVRERAESKGIYLLGEQVIIEQADREMPALLEV